jgi:cell division protein FtsQ
MTIDARRELPALPRGVIAALLSLAALLVTALAVHLLRPQFDLPLTSLRIDGELQRLSAAQIAAAAAIAPGVHLFDADLTALRARVEALPWVAHARVSRLWPDRVAVRVWERMPIARWGDAGLVDSESRSFTPAASEIPDGLPRLAGPDGREADVVTAYRALKAALEGSRLAPVALTLDARGEWSAVTADGISLHFGNGNPAASAALLLGPASHALAEHFDQVASIDLHYSNGFAVGWKNGIAPFGKPAKTRPAAPTPPAAAPATDKETPL